MCEHENRRPGREQFSDHFGGDDIVEMAVPAENAPLQIELTIGVPQHFRIVIALENQRAAIAKALFDQGVHVAEVGCNPDGTASVPDHESDRTDRVMLNRERRDLESGDLEVVAGLEFEHPPGEFPAAAQIVRRRSRRAERNPEFVAENPAPFGVVIVFMSQKRGAQPPGIKPERSHAIPEFAAGKPHIHDQCSRLAGENQCIAPAAAAENAQFDHNNPVRSRKNRLSPAVIVFFYRKIPNPGGKMPFSNLNSIRAKCKHVWPETTSFSKDYFLIYHHVRKSANAKHHSQAGTTAFGATASEPGTPESPPAGT